MDESYQLRIECHQPHARYNRTIPFNWHPSNDEIFNSIRRLRGQAANDGVDLVKIKAVALRKIETIESQCVDLDAVNLKFTIQMDDPIL
jgi:hypothetical protein